MRKINDVWVVCLLLGVNCFAQSISISDILTDDIIEKAKQFENPEILNHHMKKIPKGSLKEFINDANIKFATISSDSGDQSSLGISWDYGKDFSSVRETPIKSSDYLWTLKTSGTVAFDNDYNPKDFLTANIEWNWTFHKGGVVTSLSSEQEQEFRDAFNLDDEGDAYVKLARSVLTDEFYSRFGFNLGYETDQQFENYQLTFGAQAYFDIKSYNSKSELSRYNIFDYPAAACRWLIFREEESFSPRGTTIPTIIIGLDYVDPLQNELNLRGSTTDEYFRFKAEAATRSLLGRFFDKVVHLEGSVRFFQELSPSDTVKAQDHDQHLLLTAAIVTENGWYVSYSDGDLPFSENEDQFFELGFDTNF